MNASAANIDPFSVRQLRQPRRVKPDGGIRCSGRGHDLRVSLDRDIAIDRQLVGQSERTHAADGVPCRGEDLLGARHSSLPAKAILEFAIVETRGTRRHDQQQVALGMTVEEVIESLGDPDKRNTKVDKDGRNDTLEDMFIALVDEAAAA